MASRFSVEAVFKAVDRITAPVSRMQNRIGKMTRGIESGLRRLDSYTSKITGGMSKIRGAAIKFGGVMLGALSGAAAIALQKTADAADALSKQARRLQFPIEELQEWKFVAEQSGVSNELLDKSLGAFTKRLGEAKAGTGPLVAALKRINPELLNQLNQTESVADAFEIYIGAMRSAKSATEKAALANAAFSRSGLNLVNIADNSADAIRALRIEQRQNGNITLQQAEAAEAYNDAVNSIKKSLAGLLHGVLLPMVPTITATLRQWREWIVANRELVQARVTKFVTDLKDRIMSLVGAVVEFSQKYDIAERIGDGLDMLGRFGKFLFSSGGLILKITAGVIAFSAALKILIGLMTVVNLVMAANPITLIVIGITALIAAIAAAIIWWDDIKAAFLSLPGPVKLAIAAISGPVGWFLAAASVIKDNWEPIKTFFSDLWDGIVGTFDAAVANIMSIIDKIKSAVAWASNTGSTIGSGIARFLGFGGGEEGGRQQADGTGPQIVSPQERVARTISEQRTTNTAEVTIKDATGRAEVTKGKLGHGLTLANSGAF